MEGLSVVYAGIDTHKEKHVLCVLDTLGKVVYRGAFAADAAGCRLLADAIGDASRCAVVGIEGTASYGAGICSHLQERGYNVVEVLRPKRDKRRKGASKNDAIDAEIAARNAAARHGTSIPKSRDGWAEAARTLLSAREICVRTSTAAGNAAKSLVGTAPEPVRSKYGKMGTSTMMKSLAKKRPATGDAVADALHASLRALAKTWVDAKRRADELEALVSDLVRENAPALLEIDGCGPLAAAALGVAAGDNPERLGSESAFASLCGVAPIEASSGKVVRHRLNRGGNRQANRALHTIALNRMKYDERTRAYVAKRTAEGKSKREIVRCLKRYIAREVYRALLNPAAKTHDDGSALKSMRTAAGMTQREVAEILGTDHVRISEIEREARKHYEIRDRYSALLKSTLANPNSA